MTDTGSVSPAEATPPTLAEVVAALEELPSNEARLFAAGLLALAADLAVAGARLSTLGLAVDGIAARLPQPKKAPRATVFGRPVELGPGGAKAVENAVDTLPPGLGADEALARLEDLGVLAVVKGGG